MANTGIHWSLWQPQARYLDRIHNAALDGLDIVLPWCCLRQLATEPDLKPEGRAEGNTLGMADGRLGTNQVSVSFYAYSLPQKEELEN